MRPIQNTSWPSWSHTASDGSLWMITRVSDFGGVRSWRWQHDSWEPGDDRWGDCDTRERAVRDIEVFIQETQHEER